jgi:Na+:H+ antiporter, NhaA family
MTQAPISSPPRRSFFQRFFALEAAGGIMIMVAAVLAMIAANSPLSDAYEAFLHLPITLGFGETSLSMGLLHWVNDGLMAIFFFLVGMEIKRELCEGELSSVKQAVLPLAAAVGGVITPAIIFMAFNHGHAEAMRGWAIPTATDIAFAVGVLALFGSRVPTSLKVFLIAVAVIDDLIAVIIIALFYTSNLDISTLMMACGVLAVLIGLNVAGVRTMPVYLLCGVALWLALLHSGIHASIAGAVFGMSIPLKTHNKRGDSVLKATVHRLHPWVAYGILPLFAFANAGVVLDGLQPHNLLDPVPLGITLGLFFGKQIGIFWVSYSMVKLGVASKPYGATWGQFYGVCLMCGIGFTMSLFVGGLAYADHPLLFTETKLGVMMGSLLSGLVGYFVLRHKLKQ